MNKKVLVALLLTAIFGKVYADDCTTCRPSRLICPPDDCRRKVTSHTFFTVNPEFQGGTPERTSGWQIDRMFARKDGRYGTFQLVPFGGRSTRDSDLAAFFSIDFKPVLTVAEDLATPADIISEQLNIYTNEGASANPNLPFLSTISFEPRRNVAGLGVSYRQGFARRDDGRGFFFEMSFPIEEVKTTMHLGETIQQNGNGAITCASLSGQAGPTIFQCPLESAVISEGVTTTPVGSVCEAFQQPAWKFGRIEGSGYQSKSGVGDIDLLLGYDCINNEECYFNGYLGVLAPAGNRPHGVLMFEPIVGYNRHTAIRSGSQFGVEVWHHHTKERSMWFTFQSEFFFHLENSQIRSFDVKNKPWSRYMQVYISPEQAYQAFITNNTFLHTPGINVFTQEVKVNPGTSRIYQSAFNFNNEGFQGQLGYVYAARPAECVELNCKFPEGVAFKSLEDAGAVNNIQMINQPVICADIQPFLTLRSSSAMPSPFELYLQNTLSDEDLDMNSAAHPAWESYIIFASLGNRWDDREYPFFLNGGGSYEFTKDNSTMTRWLLWAKVGFSF